jgi:hypothetical protein
VYTTAAIDHPGQRPPPDPGQRSEQAHVLPHGQRRVQLQLLRSDPDQPPCLTGLSRAGQGIDSSDPDASGLGTDEAGDYFYEGRLAGPVAPHQAHNLARLDLEIETVKRVVPPVAFHETLRDQQLVLLTPVLSTGLVDRASRPGFPEYLY